MKSSKLFILFVLLVGCGSQLDDRSDLPTRWMGPNGNGIYPDKGLLKEWPTEGPEILWTFEELGRGFSSAVVRNGYVYITGMVDSTGFLFKLTLNGELQYRIPYGTEWTGSVPGTRGSTTLVQNKIYLVSGRGKVICFNQEDGSIIWSKEMFKDFDGKNIQWGINETPVVDGDLIFITPGGKQYNVVALNRHTGELVWSCKGEGELSAYCTPLLFTHNGRKILSTYTAEHLLGIDAVSGNLLWSVDVHWEWPVHCCTPVYHNGDLLYTFGSGKGGGGRLRLSENGDSVSDVWKNNIGLGFTSILLDGYAYGSFNEVKEMTWKCVDWETGEEMFNTKEVADGSTAFADGMLYIYTLRGNLLLVKHDPTRLHIVSQTKVTYGMGGHMAVPTIHNGILYIRHGNALIAYELKEKQVPA